MATAERAAAELEPWDALVEWLEAFLRYARSKRTLLQELREAFEKNPDLKVSSRERTVHAVDVVLERAKGAGAVRPDVAGDDVLQLVGPMCTSATLSEGQGERLLKIILDGLRPTAATPA